MVTLTPIDDKKVGSFSLSRMRGGGTPASPVGPFPGLLEQGNIDLANRPVVNNPDGSYSTVRSMSFEDNSGREILVPTVSPDGKILSNRDAMELYGKTGQNLGKFDNPDDADRYAEALHKAQARFYASRKSPPKLDERKPLHPEFDPANVPSQTPMLDKAGSFIMSALEGVPIAGPSFKNVTQDIASGLGSAISGQPIGDVRQQMAQRTDQVQEENPGTSLLGNVAGGVGPMIGLGATALGGKALGITGDSLLGRILASGASGGLINAADTAARGGGAIDALKSGGIGLGIGAVLPGLGALLNAGGSAVKDTIGPRIGAIVNPERQAAKRVGQAIEADRNNIGAPVLSQQDELSAALNNQPLMNVDRGGESARALTRSAANNDPEARALIDRKVSDRFAGQAPRAVGFIDRLMGGATDDLAAQDAIKAAARKANKPAYDKAYAEGSGGVITPELERLAGSPAIAGAMKAAAQKGQDRAIADGYGAFNPKVTFTPDGRVQFRNGKTGVPTYPDLQFWDYTKRELDDAASAARRQGRDGEAATLSNLSSTLRGELDKAVPSYAGARQGAASFFGAEDALDAGRKFVTLSKSIPETKQALAKMSSAERDAFATGFASELKDTIGTVRDRANVIDRLYGTPEARQKIELALGPEKARQFEAFTRVETVMDQLRGAMGNSTTARQLKEMGMAGAAGAGVGYATGDWKAGLTTGLLVRGARAYGAKVDETMAKTMAKFLLSDDPQQIKMAIAAASRNPKALQTVAAMQKFISSTSRGAVIEGSRAQTQP